MGTISQSDLKKVFAAVDARLQKKLDVYVIGGASAILGYNVIKETNDVDLDGGIDADFNQCIGHKSAFRARAAHR